MSRPLTFTDTAGAGMSQNGPVPKRPVESFITDHHAEPTVAHIETFY